MDDYDSHIFVEVLQIFRLSFFLGVFVRCVCWGSRKNPFSVIPVFGCLFCSEYVLHDVCLQIKNRCTIEPNMDSCKQVGFIGMTFNYMHSSA